MFTLGLYFLIVAKLRVNKVFVSSKCPSSFLSPAGARPGAGEQGVEWRSRAAGRGEGVRGGGAVLWLIRVHSCSTYASCTSSVQARGSRSDTAVRQAGMVLPSWSTAWWGDRGQMGHCYQERGVWSSGGTLTVQMHLTFAEPGSFPPSMNSSPSARTGAYKHELRSALPQPVWLSI